MAAKLIAHVAPRQGLSESTKPNCLVLCYNLLLEQELRFMAKFIIGVLVGLFLGASAPVYGAVAAGSGASSGWTVTMCAKAIVISDRPVSAGRAAKS